MKLITFLEKSCTLRKLIVAWKDLYILHYLSAACRQPFLKSKTHKTLIWHVKHKNYGYWAVLSR